jgi:transposase
MLDALINQDASTEEIAQLARKQARKKIPQIQQALEGHHMTEHHRVLIRHSMRHLAFLEEEIADLDKEISKRVESGPLETAVKLVQSIPGIQKTSAAAIVAETGADMAQFPEGANLASWIGVCPGNNETAGKRKSGRTTKGNPWARSTLVECGWSASRKKDSATQRFYGRLKPRIQHKRALVAVAHWLALEIHETLRRGTPYQDGKGPDLTPGQALRLARHHTRRLQHLHKWLKKPDPDKAATW